MDHGGDGYGPSVCRHPHRGRAPAPPRSAPPPWWPGSRRRRAPPRAPPPRPPRRWHACVPPGALALLAPRWGQGAPARRRRRGVGGEGCRTPPAWRADAAAQRPLVDDTAAAASHLDVLKHTAVACRPCSMPRASPRPHRHSLSALAEGELVAEGGGGSAGRAGGGGQRAVRAMDTTHKRKEKQPHPHTQPGGARGEWLKREWHPAEAIGCFSPPPPPPPPDFAPSAGGCERPDWRLPHPQRQGKRGGRGWAGDGVAWAPAAQRRPPCNAQKKMPAKGAPRRPAPLRARQDAGGGVQRRQTTPRRVSRKEREGRGEGGCASLRLPPPARARSREAATGDEWRGDGGDGPTRHRRRRCRGTLSGRGRRRHDLICRCRSRSRRGQWH